MPANRITLRNKTLTVSFTRVHDGAWQPEWFRLGRRAMLRFKDHEFLNIGAIRVREGTLQQRAKDRLRFGGAVAFAGTLVDWTVEIALPSDGQAGFTITTRMVPRTTPIEVLEALSTFELPYEYDGTEHMMTVMSQQPIFRFEGSEQRAGAGYKHPFWYYGKPARAHLTFPSNSPLMCCRVANADGSNARCTMLIGNWARCSVHDLFAQPTRRDEHGRQGRKFLIGAVNWNASLHKDPNVLVDPETGLSQQVLIDCAGALPQTRWDLWLATGWERMCRLHFPTDGRVPAWDVARSRGAGWVEAAEWLAAQFQKEEGCPGFFYPQTGSCVYAPHTRPKWDANGVGLFCGQWLGPLDYLAHVWRDRAIRASLPRLERLFAADQGHSPESIWTIGPAPMYCAVLRKARLSGVSRPVRAKLQDWVHRRTAYTLRPPAGARRGDGGILAWDAFTNLLAADLFDRKACEAAAREYLALVNARLDDAWWAFNCAAEGDDVAAGNARPFGHGIAMSANLLAWQRFGDPAYLAAAERFGNILLAMHFITANTSPTPDLDTRGWANGSNSGRDQLCNLPPWETAFSLEQLALAILSGLNREGFYDVLWLFSHTGLAMFPKARTLKRIYTPDLKPLYRPIDSLATERAYYLTLPYLAYEEPWDQTMLAGYQGVEPIICSLLFGGGLVRCTDDRVMALVPQAAVYDEAVADRFTVHLWNPTEAVVETALHTTVAEKQRSAWQCGGALRGRVSAEHPATRTLAVPPRVVTKVTLRNESPCRRPCASPYADLDVKL